jgi:bacteriorhodopsin
MNSFHMTQAALGGTALLQGIAAVTKSEHIKSNAIGATVCAIAYQHYDWMRRGSDVSSTRYSDWFLTLPLLLWEFALVSNISLDSQHVVPFLCSELALVCMLVVGKLSTMARWQLYRTPLLITGMLFLVLSAALYTLLVPDWRDTSTLVTLILICTWAAYGILAFARGPEWGYNMLDVLNKAGFGLWVATKAF